MSPTCLKFGPHPIPPGVILSGWAELSLKDVEGEADSAELQAFCRDKVTWQIWQCPADVQLPILVVQMWTNWTHEVTGVLVLSTENSLTVFDPYPDDVMSETDLPGDVGCSYQ